MSSSIKNSLKIAGAVIGTIVGAGFASGMEIMQFFTVFGENGLIGIFLTGVLLTFVCIAVLETIRNERINNYSDYLENIAGKRVGKMIEIMVMLFLWACFYVMICASGTFFKENFGIHALWGTIFLAVICFFVFIFDVRGIVAVNAVISPLIVIGILIIWVATQHNQAITVFNGGSLVPENWFFSAIVYTSYNSIVLIAVLANIRECISSKKEVYLGTALGVGSLVIIALATYSLTYTYLDEIIYFQVPMAAFAKGIGKGAFYLYGVIFILAVFTSAVSAGFCFLKKVSLGDRKKLMISAMILCVSSIIFYKVDFSQMIGFVYPVFGYLGLIQIGLCFLKHMIKY